MVEFVEVDRAFPQAGVERVGRAEQRGAGMHLHHPDTAIGVAHLRPEAGKKAREDFLSSETLSLIEAAATRSEDLSWAAEGQKRLKNQRSSHGYRLKNEAAEHLGS